VAYNKRVFRTLDGMRGIAAALVVLRHLKQYLVGPVGESYLAVDLFFLLSGVVIARSYEWRLETSLSVLEFMKIRLARIYPLYVFGTLISVVTLIAQGRGVEPGPLMMGLLFVPAILGSQPYPLDHPCWSLCFELVGNVIHARLLRLLTPTVLAGTCAVSAVLLMISAKRWGNLDIGWTHQTFFYGICRLTFSYFLGILLCRHFDTRRGRPAEPIHSNWACAALLGALGLILSGIPHLTRQPYYDLVAVLLVFPALVWGGLIFEPSNRLASLCKNAGLVSYAMYVLHVPLGGLILNLVQVRSQKPLVSFGFMTDLEFGVLFVGLCLLIDRCADVPIRKWLLKEILRAPQSKESEGFPQSLSQTLLLGATSRVKNSSTSSKRLPSSSQSFTTL
jgi:peptidoglycan/LPS O-acetylase OafA/YrhL